MSRVLFPAAVRRVVLLLACLVGAVAALSNASCASNAEPASSSYFDRTIGPILAHSCSRQTTGCHTADARGNAPGNLDTTSFDMINRRHDLLVTYGPYSAPGLLTKVGGPQSITVSTLGDPISVTTDIRHAAGSGIDVTSEGYATLRRWMDGGATAENVGTTSGQHLVPSGECNHTIPSDPLFDGTKDPPAFDVFKNEVQPVLKACSAGSCHGNIVADFQLVCPDDDAHVRWNAYIAAQFLSKTPEASELVRRPLDPARGGVFHEGGIVFNDPNDADYQKLVSWAKTRGFDPPDTSNPGFVFFANRVQPTLVRKGCMFLGCHSPQMFHDMRLRGGSGGQFSIVATRRNYDMSKLMLAIEAPDPNVSRLVAKNLYPYDPVIDDKALGIRHRGGALLEDFPTTAAGETLHHAVAADCAKIDADAAPLDTVPAYCILVRWHQIEREAAITKGAAGGGVDKDPLSGIVYVVRPPNKDVPQAFDTYAPGATLHVRAATMAADGTVSVGADKDVTSGCGLSEASADIRGPAVSDDASTIAFAARSSAAEPLQIYTMKSDGSACGKQAAIGQHDPSADGILEHDFDPAFLADGRIVFASSRGTTGNVAYAGKPTRTPSTLLPNSNLWIIDDPKDAKSARQLTFLLDAELAPDVMRDGRIVLTTEKRAPGFYQLAGRRINADGGDYHPLYAQRKSIGFEQLTEIHELADRNFVGVFSDKGAVAGAGTIGVVNRSLGPDQDDRDPADRPYLHSLSLPDAGATGKNGAAGGAYRSPAPLPARAMLVSYAAGADVGSFDGRYELVEIDERTGKRTPLVNVAGKSVVDAAAIYARPTYRIFESRVDEVNGATTIAGGGGPAELHYLDVNLLSSLLFANTRTGRDINVSVNGVGILEDLPPDSSLTSFDALSGDSYTDSYGKMWVRRLRLTGGLVPTAEDGSIAMRLPSGVPFVLELYVGANLVATQREEFQLYPGERARSAFRRNFFDAQCGGCHGSITGREVDVHLQPDVLTSASRVAGFDIKLQNDFNHPPSERGAPIPIDPALGK